MGSLEDKKAWLRGLGVASLDALPAPGGGALLPGGPADASDGAPGGGEARGKLATKVDVVAIKLVDHPTKYGAIKVGGKIRATTTSEGDGEVTKTYTANDKGERGVKKGFSLAEMESAGMLGFEISKVAVELELEGSGAEVAVGASLSFEAHTKLFTSPAKCSAKVVVLKYSGKEGLSLPGIELTISQAPATIVTGPETTKITAELKGSYAVDKEKVVKEIGKAVLKRVAKEALEKEAKKQGVKMLGRAAGEAVLKDLGPIAAAFSVGLDIGEFLNEYTVASQVAKVVMDDILGDLNEQYHSADTLGKMWVLSKNSPRIVAALVAAGVAGAVTGMADLVLFKIMGLPGFKDFEEAYKRFAAGLHEMGKVAEMTRDNIEKTGPGAIVYGALMLGIKTNPKHAICAHGALEPIIAAIFAKLHPLYKPGGVNDVLSVKVGSAAIDAAALEKFSAHVAGIRHRKYDGGVDMTDAKSVAAGFKGMRVEQFLTFLEKNDLIRYNVKTDGGTDADAIDQKLLDELYAGTPLEHAG